MFYIHSLSQNIVYTLYLASEKFQLVLNSNAFTKQRLYNFELRDVDIRGYPMSTW